MQLKITRSLSRDKLKKLANKIGEKSTNNNSYGLKNEFYTHRVRPEIEKLKQSQTNWDYRCSPDFQIFRFSVSFGTIC